jgi:hypothetical protein
MWGIIVTFFWSTSKSVSALDLFQKCRQAHMNFHPQGQSQENLIDLLSQADLSPAYLAKCS